MNVKLADFGLSTFQSKDHLLRTACGSPNYVAPEVLLRHPYDGSKADMWSCGIVLFALLFGELPFYEES